MKVTTMHPASANLTRAGRLAHLGVCLLVLAWATASPAVVNVFHSPGDDGDRYAGVLVLPIESTQQLDLWIERGSRPTGTGSVCESGDGDEICAWDVAVELNGDISIVSWTPEDPDTRGTPVGSMLKINGLVDSPAEGPLRLGRLVVSAGRLDGEVSATGNKIVNSDQRLEDVSGSILARVPEPGSAVGFVGGLTVLALLERMRSRRAT